MDVGIPVQTVESLEYVKKKKKEKKEEEEKEEKKEKNWYTTKQVMWNQSENEKQNKKW